MDSVFALFEHEAFKPLAEPLAAILGEPFDLPLFLMIFGSCAAGILVLTALLSLRLPTGTAFKVSYEIVVFPIFVQLSVWGFHIWATTPMPIEERTGTLDLRWADPQFYYITNVTQAFYVFDLFVSLVKEPSMALHHVLMVVTARIGKVPYANYITYFFAGAVELSNVPLRVMNLHRHLPGLKDALPGLELLSMGLFAVSFFAMRIFWWTWLSWTLTVSAERYIAAGLFDEDMVLTSRVGTCALAAFTAMQYFWGYKIVLKALRVLGRSKKKAA